MKQTPFNNSWRLFVVLVFLSGSLAFLVNNSQLFPLLTVVQSQIPTIDQFELPLADSKTELLSQETQNLLKGEETQKTGSEPLHFAQFVRTVKTLPSDYHDTVAKLAPGNSWFDLRELVTIAPTAFQLVPPADDDWERANADYKILDTSTFAQATRLFLQAGFKRDYDDYTDQIAHRLIGELPSPTTYLTQFQYITSLGQVSTNQDVVMLSDFFSAAVQESIRTDDHTTFLALEESARHLSRAFHKNAYSSISLLMLRVWLERVNIQIRQGAEHFNNSEMTLKYLNLTDALVSRDALMSDRKSHRIESWNTPLLPRYGSLMANLTLRFDFSTTQKRLTQADLKPSCRAEKAAFSRIFVAFIFLIFPACALALWFKTLRVRSDQKSGLTTLGPAARWKMLLFGVILPLALTVIIRYLTPLGKIDESIYWTTILHIILPLVSSALFIFTATIFTARRLTDSSYPLDWKSFTLLLLPLSAIVIEGCSGHAKSDYWLRYSAIAVATFSLSWVAFIGVRHTFRKSTVTYRRSHLAIPAMLLASGMVGLAASALVLEEKYWVSQDQVTAPIGAYISKYDQRVSTTFKAELKQLLP